MQSLFAPSLLRALVSRNVLVSVLALVMLVAVAIYESNQLILSQFADESGILADVALNEITDQTVLATNAASLVASLPTTDGSSRLPRRGRATRSSRSWSRWPKLRSSNQLSSSMSLRASSFGPSMSSATRTRIRSG